MCYYDFKVESYTLRKLKKEEKSGMKKTNPYATNVGGIIKSPKTIVTNSPKATVEKGKDLRVGKGKK